MKSNEKYKALDRVSSLVRRYQIEQQDAVAIALQLLQSESFISLARPNEYSTIFVDTKEKVQDWVFQQHPEVYAQFNQKFIHFFNQLSAIKPVLTQLEGSSLKHTPLETISDLIAKTYQEALELQPFILETEAQYVKLYRDLLNQLEKIATIKSNGLYQEDAIERLEHFTSQISEVSIVVARLLGVWDSFLHLLTQVKTKIETYKDLDNFTYGDIELDLTWMFDSAYSLNQSETLNTTL